MNESIPSAMDIRVKLASMSHAAVLKLSEKTAVPFTTLWKIRSGETMDPRIETVRRIWPELVGRGAGRRGVRMAVGS